MAKDYWVISRSSMHNNGITVCNATVYLSHAQITRRPM